MGRQVLLWFSVCVYRTLQVSESVCGSSGNPEAGVPVQQDELPSLQRAAVLLSVGGGGGAEGTQFATCYCQHPHVSVPAGTFPGAGAAPCLFLCFHQQRYQYVNTAPPVQSAGFIKGCRKYFVSVILSTDSPYALIVRRYLSLLDAAVELEYRDYTGPRLQDTHKVLMFDHALTADEVNRKYR